MNDCKEPTAGCTDHDCGRTIDACVPGGQCTCHSLYVLYLILMIGIAKGGCVIYVDTYFYEYCIS